MCANFEKKITATGHNACSNINNQDIAEPNQSCRVTKERLYGGSSLILTLDNISKNNITPMRYLLQVTLARYHMFCMHIISLFV